MQRVKTSYALAGLTVVISVLLATATAEVAYRLYLYIRLDLPAAGSYQAVNAPTSVYSKTHGYDYVPSSTFTMVTIRTGAVAMCNQIVSNSDRNLGRERNPLYEHDPTILVVGDSFSDNAHLGGITWPDLMADRLSRDSGQPVSVLNYSRSGYGVAQMFSMAAEQVERNQAQLLLIPFILNDLTRARFWRTSREKDGETRFYQSASPALHPRLADSFDVSLVDADINDAWCGSALTRPDPENPVLTRLNDRYKKLAITSDRETRLMTLSKSLLYRRIVEHDFSLKQARMVQLPGYEFQSYALDPLFRENLQRLKDSGVPIQLIRLPLYEELVQGAYIEGTPQEQSLLKSLEQASGSQVTPLLPPNQPERDLASLFLLPNDSHPSAAGAAFYAREVSQRIALQNLADAPATLPPDAQAASAATPFPPPGLINEVVP